MRLAEFIVANSEPILREFEEFARSHTTAGENMNLKALRDHGAALLTTIARDIEQPQSESDQASKSKGDAPPAPEAGPSAAELHGTDRAVHGFTPVEMFAEYRALRASVLRLWIDAQPRLEEDDLQDLIRFNEAIDQALAESITRYSTGIQHSRDMFLAILGHDLRNPLGTVLTASSFLMTEGELSGANLTMVSRIRSSGERMLALVSDLLDFTRSHLGSGIPITCEETDVGNVARETVEEIATHHPDREVHFEASGDLGGRWDAKRVSQALSNLLGNAVQHGAAGASIQVNARGETDEVIIAVRNRGVVIAREDWRKIFDPFRRIAAVETGATESGSMGLGLYIAQQIAIAHGGRIEVSSSEGGGTVFELHLPRSASPAHHAAPSGRRRASA